MKISILASGSSGNATFISTKKHKILVDAGLSGKKIEQLFNKIGYSMDDVDILLVTHEHNDHSHSVGILARRYPKLQVYANELTWHAMDKTIGKINNDQKHIFEMGVVKSFDDIDIESFGVSHDAAAAQFYRFYSNNHSFVILTDTGYVSKRIENIIFNADAYLMECNHDFEMLRNGTYPWNVKQRILSDVGHLSNVDSANVMTHIIGPKTKKIFLGHLSLENNLKIKARSTVSSILKQHDLGLNYNFYLYDTDPQKPSNLFNI